MTKVPFLDLKSGYFELKLKLDNLWQEINSKGIYILGSKLEEFEKKFASYLSVKHVIGVGNGLDALTLSLRALGVQSGDEVIVPAHTFIASWLAVSEIGANPIPVEIDEKTYLIDTSKIEKSITKKTKAIMPVHLYGRVCDMNPIIEISKKYNIKILEDAAQAHGAFDVNTKKKAGCFGDIAGFSFYPGKNLGCFGDGGAIATNDDDLAEELRKLRNYGGKAKYQHEIIGINSRLDELQAGILTIKLDCLDEWNERRSKVAKIYIDNLRGVGDLVLPEYCDGHVWHIFAVRTVKRDSLKDFLERNEVGVNIHYPAPIHLQGAYKYLNYSIGNYSTTEKVCCELLSLPIGPHIDNEQVMFCIKKIKEFFAN